MKNLFSSIKMKREQKKEQKKNKLLKIISWSISAWLFLFALIFMPSIGSVLMALGGIIVMPISNLQEFLSEKLRIKKIVKVILVTVLFFVGIFTVPMEDTGSVDPMMQTNVSKELSDVQSVTMIEETTAIIEAVKEASKEETVPTEPETSKVAVRESEEERKEKSTFSINFIDVGQADAALVECDGHYLLIDGGNTSDSNKMYAILEKLEIAKLDMIVGTHVHEDHIGGLPGALNYTTADITLCPVATYDSDEFSDFKKYAVQNGGGITVPEVGNEYELGSASVKVLGVNSAFDENNSSIILKITYGDTSFVFAGDAEAEAENIILDSGYDLSATVLKVGHHGSDSSTSEEFLRKIMPEYAIISVGQDNVHGHPTEEVLERLAEANVRVFRTDMQGDIYCTSDGKTVTFKTEREVDEADIMIAGSIPVVETLISTLETEVSIREDVVRSTELGMTEIEDLEITAEETIEPIVSGIDYVLNTNSKKFHYPSCKSVKKMKDKNKREFTGTRDEVIDMGYDPCGNCNP